MHTNRHVSARKSNLQFVILQEKPFCVLISFVSYCFLASYYFDHKNKISLTSILKQVLNCCLFVLFFVCLGFFCKSTKKLNFAQNADTTFLHSHDEMQVNRISKCAMSEAAFNVTVIFRIYQVLQ